MPLDFIADYPLDTLNTLRLPCRAKRYVEILSANQLMRLAHSGVLATERCVLLGGGSNMVLPSELDAMVLRMGIPGRELIGSDDDAHYVRAGAGENWHELVRWTLEMGWPGLENLALIPGTVGAAPIQNIGAYGLEVGERFFSLEAIDLKSGNPVTFKHDDCQFGYRDSVFKHMGAGRFAITSVTFRLPKRWQPILRYAELNRELTSQGIISPQPAQIATAVTAMRTRKLPDPAKIGNAGSFFKNPQVGIEQFVRLRDTYADLPNYPQGDGQIKLAAGWLIEQCGWKGRFYGAVGMYEHQALVLVTRAGATGEEVLRVAEMVRHDVAMKFGVTLEIEPVQV